MEFIAVLFVVGVFTALLLPEVKPPKKSAGDKLVEGIKATYDEVVGGSGGGGKPGGKDDDGPWRIIFITIFVGLMFTLFQ